MRFDGRLCWLCRPACAGRGAAAEQGRGGRRPGGHQQHGPGPEGKSLGCAAVAVTCRAAVLSCARLSLRSRSCIPRHTCRCLWAPMRNRMPCAGICAGGGGPVPCGNRPLQAAAAAEHGRRVTQAGLGWAGHSGRAGAWSSCCRPRRHLLRCVLCMGAAPVRVHPHEPQTRIVPRPAGDSAGEGDAAGVSPAVRMLQQNTRLGERQLACRQICRHNAAGSLQLHMGFITQQFATRLPLQSS